MASFPESIARFTTKRNEQDDVDASHINAIQDEIVALETYIGSRPNVSDTGRDPAWSWKTVRDRLDYMIRGQHIPVFTAGDNTPRTYNTDVLSLRALAKPSSSDDTHGLYYSNGFKIKRDGFYFLEGRAYFGATPLKGTRRLQILSKQGAAFSVVTHTDLDNKPYPRGQYMATTWVGRLKKDDVVNLYVNFETLGYPGGKYAVTSARMGGFMLRDLNIPGTGV